MIKENLFPERGKAGQGSKDKNEPEDARFRVAGDSGQERSGWNGAGNFGRGWILSGFLKHDKEFELNLNTVRRYLSILRRGVT